MNTKFKPSLYNNNFVKIHNAHQFIQIIVQQFFLILFNNIKFITSSFINPKERILGILNISKKTLHTMHLQCCSRLINPCTTNELGVKKYDNSSRGVAERSRQPIDGS